MKQIMFSTILLMTFFACLSGCKRERSYLTSVAGQIKSITVYQLSVLSNSEYSKQDLDNALQAFFPPKLFRELVLKTKFEDKWVLWKESRLAVVKLNDGSEKRLA